ncbi:hypothetical protein NLX83_26025 [Allokutzneria sp. A3M-2-11 16]|uniref:hypothetical protein n=1 Tax=Allokutzneria sp. A3M-2-11 16 TaxID=2962043 RepID=UPI0020B73CEA|nr:hypothetical protein [Allokutzneria sp. A3M-2-11 16]MCP3802736.1 hypothetical protein [Allokutzneria sp. A3M-2-11 16]
MKLRVLSVVIVLAGAVGPAAANAREAAVEPCNRVAVGPAQVVVDNPTRQRLGLNGWPDTAFGVLPEGNGNYKFLSTAALVGAGGQPQSIAVTRGTLDNPVAGGVVSMKQVTGLAPPYQYAGGGPVYRDPGSGLVLQVLHLERKLSEQHHFYADLHLGVHDPATGATTLIGEIVSPDMDFATADQHDLTADIGTSSLVPRDGHLYLYFPDYSFENGGFKATGLSVARAPLAEVIDAAKRKTVTPWAKFHQGGWSSAGKNGPSTSLREAVGPWHPNVVRTTRGGTIMVAGNSITEFEFSHSPNGMTGWTPAQPLFRDPERGNAYPTVVGLGADPSVVDDKFYVYYLQWAKAGDWSNAVAMRRLITCVAGRPAGQSALVGFSNGTQHRTTTDAERTPGFAPVEGKLWHLADAPADNTTGIHSCRNGASDQFLSKDPGCEGKQNSILQTEGWLYNAPPAAPSTPLYRCRVGGTHYTATTEACDNKAGAVSDGLLGHALTSPKRAFSRFYDGREHWDTSGPVTARYSLEHRYFLENSTKPGTVPLYGCSYTSAKGLNHFTSLREDCEGQTKLRVEGWIYPAKPAEPSVELHRCYWKDQDDHFLTPFRNCENVPNHVYESSFGFALTS